MHAIKTKLQIPEDHHLSLTFDVPLSVPAGLTDVMIIFETKKISRPKQRVLGQFSGKVTIADDFDAELGDDFWMGDA